MTITAHDNFPVALVLGAASPLGWAVANALLQRESTTIILADGPARIGLLSDLSHALRPRLTSKSHRFALVLTAMHLGESDLGLTDIALEAMRGAPCRIFHLGLDRDRTIPRAALLTANRLVTRGVIALAKSIGRLESLVAVGDIGLAGDYRGRFYESWLDVGQRPWDEVDKTSLEAEIDFVEEKSLPTVRARVGLLTDLESGIPLDGRFRTAALTLIPALRILRHLPQSAAIPVAMEEGCLPPLTPLAWCGQALVALALQREAAGHAVHLVAADPPPMAELIEQLTRFGGGARLRGAPLTFLGPLTLLPGVHEAVKLKVDRAAALLTPHRYCRTRGDFDLGVASRLLPRDLVKAPLCRANYRDFFAHY